jgi:hypothetical protein
MKLQTRTRAMLAWSLWLATLACCASGLLAALPGVRPSTLGVLVDGVFSTLAFPLGLATVGLVVGLRRPGNPIGWLYGAAGLAWSLFVPWDPWLDQLVDGRQPLPLAAQLAAVAWHVAWAPAVACGITLPALLLPDGKLRSRRWRVVVATSAAGATMVVVAGSLAPGPLTDRPIDNPFGLAGPAGTVAGVVSLIGVLLHWGSLPAAAVCVLLRFRASGGVERQQLRWAGVGAAVGVTALLLAGVLPAGFENFLVPLAVLCPPVAVAVAVLRYRLWDLDRLVSRTVTYALVTALLVVPYLVIVLVVTRLAEGAGDLAVAAATLATAAAFSPLRRPVKDRVDRRFNRRRYDAARTVEGFAGRLREQVDLDVLSAELLAVVDQAMQPTRASLWLAGEVRASRGV